MRMFYIIQIIIGVALLNLTCVNLKQTKDIKFYKSQIMNLQMDLVECWQKCEEPGKEDCINDACNPKPDIK